MNGERQPKGLGMGLSALLGEAVRPAPSVGEPDIGGVREIEIARIRPNPSQPRVHFDDEALDELSKSISARGVLQPILLALCAILTIGVITLDYRFAVIVVMSFV